MPQERPGSGAPTAASKVTSQHQAAPAARTRHRGLAQER
jgi:hypothetical protein